LLRIITTILINSNLEQVNSISQISLEIFAPNIESNYAYLRFFRSIRTHSYHWYGLDDHHELFKLVINLWKIVFVFSLAFEFLWKKRTTIWKSDNRGKVIQKHQKWGDNIRAHWFSNDKNIEVAIRMKKCQNMSVFFEKTGSQFSG